MTDPMPRRPEPEAMDDRAEAEACARAVIDRYAADESELLREEFYRSLLSAYTVEEIRTQLAAAGMAGLEVAMCSDRHWDVAGGHRRMSPWDEPYGRWCRGCRTM